MPQAGDTANHTIYWSKDGVNALATNTPTGVTTPTDVGESNIVLTAAECTANAGKLSGRSSTPNVVIIAIPVTFEQLPTSGSYGNTYYVSTVGSDANDGKTPTRTWLTIGHAFSTAVAGDLILFGPGAFASAGDQTLAAGVTVRGAGPETTTLTFSGLGGGGIVPGNGCRISDMTITGPNGDCVSGNGCTGLSVERCRLVAGSTGVCIYVSNTSTARVVDCRLDSSGGAIKMAQVTGTGIMDLVNCRITGDASVGTVTVSGGECRLIGCLFDTTATLDLVQTGGILLVSGTAYLPSKASGTITVVGPGVNVTQVNGATPQTYTPDQIASGVLKDVVTGDLSGAPAGSLGKIITQLGGTFTTSTSSVFSVAALANAPAGGGGGGDPLTNLVPGSYTPGQAGYVLGHKIPATVAANDCVDALATLAICQIYADQLPTGVVAANPSPTTSTVTVVFAASVSTSLVLIGNAIDFASYGGSIGGTISGATGTGTTWALTFAVPLGYAPTNGDKAVLKGSP